MSKISELLEGIPLFQGLPASEIERLAGNLRLIEIPEDSLIFREDGQDDFFYILIEGQVGIIKALGAEGERLMAIRDEGAVLGEMSFFLREGRHSASVISRTPLLLLEMTRREFDDLLHRFPELAYELVRLLSERLDESENITIQDLLEKNLQLTHAYQELQLAQAQIIEKEKLEHELEIARQIQTSFLPNTMPRHPKLDFGAIMIPARAVGGDFFDIIPLSDERFVVVVGDVSDKGVPAALFMALTYSLLRVEAMKGGSLENILILVNRYLVDLNVSNMFVTILFGILDISKGTFDYFRAGHPSPICMDREHNLVEVGSSLGQPLGLFDEPVLDKRSVEITPGSTLLVFSDGLSEATNIKGESVTDDIQKILSPVWDRSAQEICSYVFDYVCHLDAPEGQMDDFTLVCIKCAK
jgi:phosphoserine phosphatase RsbU/P